MSDQITPQKHSLHGKTPWRLTQLEKAVLRASYQRNDFPAREEKQTIIQNLKDHFDSEVTVDQLSHWFYNERVKSTRKEDRNTARNKYLKFNSKELELLNDSYTENNYPSLFEMQRKAETLNVKPSKIENWYKHHRRSLASRGLITLKTKKLFNKDELTYLIEMFNQSPHLTKRQASEAAEHLDCAELHIKNWYSNKRKKVKTQSQTEQQSDSDTSKPQCQITFTDSSEKEDHSINQSTQLSEQIHAEEMASQLQSELMQQYSAPNPLMRDTAQNHSVQPSYYSLPNYSSYNSFQRPLHEHYAGQQPNPFMALNYQVYPSSVFLLGHQNGLSQAPTFIMTAPTQDGDQQRKSQQFGYSTSYQPAHYVNPFAYLNQAKLNYTMLSLSQMGSIPKGAHQLMLPNHIFDDFSGGK